MDEKAFGPEAGEELRTPFDQTLQADVPFENLSLGLAIRRRHCLLRGGWPASGLISGDLIGEFKQREAPSST